MPGFREATLLTITLVLFIILLKQIDRKGKSVERRGRKATGLKLKSDDSRVAEVTCSSLWECLPKGFFIFRLFLSIYSLVVKICMKTEQIFEEKK
jgi:hypothetical protein